MSDIQKMFSGKYEAECVADHRDCLQGKSDLPCYRVKGPRGLEVVVWGRDLWNEQRAIFKALEYLGVDLDILGSRTIFEVGTP